MLGSEDVTEDSRHKSVDVCTTVIARRLEAAEVDKTIHAVNRVSIDNGPSCRCRGLEFDFVS